MYWKKPKSFVKNSKHVSADGVRMLDAVPLLAVTVGFIGLFLYIFANLQLEVIRNNWDSMRCEIPVIAIAHMVPDGKDPTVDPTKFAVNNLNFCLTKLMDASISLAMAPVMGLFSKQIDATKPINNSMNYLRASAQSIIQPLTSVFDSLWQKLRIGVYMISRIYQKLHSSFDRVFGIAVSTIFAGMGMYKAIQNFMNVVVLVILIIMGIILVLMIFAFPFVFPALPIVMTTIAVLSASVFAGSVGGMASSFCVFPGTLVATPDGWKPIEKIQPGDALRNGTVEGVLKTTGKGAKCVSIHGVKMSETHLVLDNYDKTWKFASNHPLAQNIDESTPFLYCLNTTTRIWNVKANLNQDQEKEVILRDWEELPLDKENDKDWEKQVFSILNENSPLELLPSYSNPGRGLLSSSTQVWEKTKGNINVSNIVIGDFIKDSYITYTEVLGIYKDSNKSTPYSGPNSSIWMWNFDMQLWTHAITAENNIYKEPNIVPINMYHLITKSGIFLIEDKNYIRDFTEIGVQRISQTYSFMEDLLNYK